MQTQAEVFVVLFRRFTRPGAHSELRELLKRFESIGRVSFVDFDAVYSTPPFEEQVLVRLGLPAMPSWRAGDVVKIELFSHPDISTFQTDGWPTSKWERFDLGEQVLAIRDDPADCGPIRVEDDLPSEVKSVSQRDPTRARYNVWTSRSRAAVVRGTRRLAAILNKSTEVTINQSDFQVATQLSRQLGLQIRR